MINPARQVLQFRESHDQKGSQAGIEVRTGRKWRATEAVDKAESRLHPKDLAGTVAIGRAGLGTIPSAKYKARSRAKIWSRRK